MKTYITVHAIAKYKNKYLILQRAEHRSSPSKWNSVTGYIQDRESAEEAAVRELKEETNLQGKILKTSEPYWVDSGEKRWVVIASLIEVSNVSSLQIDENESQAYKWVGLDNEIIRKGKALKMSLEKLGVL